MSNTPFVQFAKDLHKKNENDIYAIVYEAIRKNMIADDYLILNIEYQ